MNIFTGHSWEEPRDGALLSYRKEGDITWRELSTDLGPNQRYCTAGVVALSISGTAASLAAVVGTLLMRCTGVAPADPGSGELRMREHSALVLHKAPEATSPVLKPQSP